MTKYMSNYKDIINNIGVLLVNSFISIDINTKLIFKPQY